MSDLWCQSFRFECTSDRTKTILNGCFTFSECQRKRHSFISLENSEPFTLKIYSRAISLCRWCSAKSYSINHLPLVHLFVNFRPEFPLDRYPAGPVWNNRFDLFCDSHFRNMRKMMIDTSEQSSSQSVGCLLSAAMSVNIVCISRKNSLQFLRSSVISCLNSPTTFRWFSRSRCRAFISFRTSIRLSAHKTCFAFWLSVRWMHKRDRILQQQKKIRSNNLLYISSAMMHSVQLWIPCLVFGHVRIVEY